MLTQLARVADVALWVERDEAAGRTPLPTTRVEGDRRRLENLGVRVLPYSFTALRRTLEDGRHDTVLFEAYEIAARYLQVVRDQRPGAALIVDSVDVHFARLAAGAAVGAVSTRSVRRVHRAEIGAYRAADAVIVVSAEDADALRTVPGVPAVVRVPNCVTVRPRISLARAPEALFVGHFNHAPNLDGLRWFVRDIWPLVRLRRPDARLTVIGSHATADVRALGRVPGVDVLGYVADLEPYLARAAAAVAPLRYGAGMKGKVTDAMAAGIPVVTTTVGAQGLDIESGRHALVADDAAAFADALERIFDDPDTAARLGLAGQTHVGRLCGPDALAEALRPLLGIQACDRPDTGLSAPLVRRLRLARLQLRHWCVSLARSHAARLVPGRTGLTGSVAP